MAVDAKTVREIANLARLTVSDSDVDTLAEEMGTILGLMGTIGAWEGLPEVDRRSSSRRADRPKSCKDANLISSAAQTDGNAVVVPPVKGAS